MASFPTSIVSPTDPTASDKLSSPDHALQHQSHNGEIVATQTKLGTGSATPTSSALLVGDGAGSSTWDTSPADLTLDTPTLNTPDLNGTELILDADADTSLTADTDNQIDVKIAGADDFRFTANTFTALSGSTIAADTIAETTSANGVTIDGVNMKDNKVATAKSVTATSADDGFVVQVVNTTSNAAATTTTVMPRDDTIPQNDEGGEFMTLAITPKSSTNILVIEIVAILGYSGSNSIVGAIFQDSTADALAASTVRSETGDRAVSMALQHAMVAGTTSETTFKFRAGAAASGTLTFNGDGGSRLFGDIVKSSIVITEYKSS